ncbi:MAG: response regulator [Acidobacteriia bacterium]|nr:response regulator [Terriglobia bacterium]
MGYAAHILVVEDEPLIQKLIRRALAADGYSVTAVGTARQALENIQNATFDVVVLDMSLPDEDGIETLRQIRADAPYTPVVAISGMMVSPMRRAARAAGAQATLSKPMRFEKLRDAVSGLAKPDRLHAACA